MMGVLKQRFDQDSKEDIMAISFRQTDHDYCKVSIQDHLNVQAKLASQEFQDLSE